MNSFPPLSRRRLVIGIVAYIIFSEFLKDIIIFQHIEPYLQMWFTGDAAELFSEFLEYVLLASILAPGLVYLVVNPVNRANRELQQANLKVQRMNEDLRLEILQRQKTEEVLRKSEKLFDAIFQDSNDGILLAEIASKKFAMANGVMCDMLGYSREELLQLSVPEIHPPGDLPRILQDFERQVRREIKIAEGLPIQRKDGTIFYADVSTTSVTLDNRAHLVGFFRDITERRRAEQALRGSEERFRLLFENSKDAIYASTSTGTLIQANQAFCDLFQLAASDTAGFKIENIYLTPADRAIFIQEIEKRGFVKNFQVKLRDSSGKELDGEITATLHRPTADGDSEYQGIIRNVTEEKQRQAEKEKLIAALSDALARVKTLSGLLPICSHCKKIRDDKGYWNQIETYIEGYSDAQFSHSICQECARIHYPDIDLGEE